MLIWLLAWISVKFESKYNSFLTRKWIWKCWYQNIKKYDQNIILICSLFVYNPLWPSDAIWWHRSVSTLDQVLACYLMASSHKLRSLMMCANNRERVWSDGGICLFTHYTTSLSSLHRCSWRYLISKDACQVQSVECVFTIKPMLAIIFL